VCEVLVQLMRVTQSVEPPTFSINIVKFRSQSKSAPLNVHFAVEQEVIYQVGLVLSILLFCNVVQSGGVVNNVIDHKNSSSYANATFIRLSIAVSAIRILLTIMTLLRIPINSESDITQDTQCLGQTNRID
jgi:hypothetical protein